MNRLTFLLCLTVAIELGYGFSVSTAEAPIKGEYKQSLEIDCSSIEGPVMWTKSVNKTALVDPKGTIYKVQDDNNTLVINSITHEVVDVYVCTSKNDASKEMYFNIYVPATVRPADKPRNIVEDDPLELECKAWGVPEPTITWEFNGTDLHAEGSGGQIKIIPSKKDSGFPVINNATLRIETIKYNQGGVYVCYARNEYEGEVFIANATMTVNVKDKYAALWPFLGICVEVAVLCTIILIYERRRAKRIEEEERQEEAAHLNANNDNRAPISDDVRQRK